MAKYNLYAVAYGKDPDTGESVVDKICTSWKECEKYIKGVTGAKYKGFYTEEEAKKWFDKVTDDDKIPDFMKQSVYLENHNELIERHNNDIIDIKFDKICKSHGVEPSVMLQNLKRQFINTYDMLNII